MKPACFFPFCVLVAIIPLWSLPFFSVAQTSPYISSLTPNGQLTWTNVLPGHLYAIEDSSDLRAWASFAENVPATGSTMTVSVPITAAPDFFRVVDRGTGCTNSGGGSAVTAEYLGSACADTTPTVITRSGCGPAWFSVRAAECSSSTTPLQLSVFLTSPAGSDYDLYVSSPPWGTASFIYPGSAPEAMHITWGGTFGFDDSTTALIEIRRKAGYDCSNWELTVHVGS